MVWKCYRLLSNSGAQLNRLRLSLMPDPLAARQLLRAYGIRPDKNLGQNFIVDREALDAILLAAELHRTEHVVEVGAGLGALTRRLSDAAAHVTAI